MKLILLLIFLLVSCGKEKIRYKEDTIGGYREFIQRESSEDEKVTWAQICTNLQEKDNKYKTSYTPAGIRFYFNVHLINCDGSEVTNDGNVKAKLLLTNEKLSYIVEEGNYFASEVETHNSGMISAICEELPRGDHSLKLPIKVDNKAFWYSLNAPGCKNTLDTQCVTVETGFIQTNGLYKAMISDGFVISLKPEELGNIIDHQRIDSTRCTNNQSIHRSTKLLTIK